MCGVKRYVLINWICIRHERALGPLHAPHPLRARCVLPPPARHPLPTDAPSSATEGFRKLLTPATAATLELVTHPEVDGVFSREELLGQATDAAAVFCLTSDVIDAKFLELAGPSLQIVSTMSVGFNHIDLDVCRAKGIRVGHTPGVLDETTAETAVALTFAAKRRIVECSDSARQGTWGRWKAFGYCGTDVSHNTVGVIGLGRIGLAYARMMKCGFNCKILYTGPREKPEHVAALGGDVEFVDLPTLLQRSDIVSIHSPLNDSTRGMINAQCFAQMKPSAVFINTSRGAVVAQDALVQALETKQIAYAGLDVVTPEPLPSSHKLFSLPNCVVLPHIGSETIKTCEAMINMANENMLAGLLDQPLPHSVL